MTSSLVVIISSHDNLTYFSSLDSAEFRITPLVNVPLKICAWMPYFNHSASFLSHSRSHLKQEVTLDIFSPIICVFLPSHFQA